MKISVVPAHEVPEVFAERLAGREADERAFTVSMTVDFDNTATQALIEHGRSNDVFAVDRRGHEHGFAPVFSKPKEHQDARDDFIDRFPGQYVLLGEPRGRLTDSLIGRSHIKAKTVGNRALSLGDVNCSTTCFDENIGLMLDFESGEFVSFLERYVTEHRNLRDEAGERFHLDDENEVLVDYGKSKESVILSSLLEDLGKDSVSSVLMSSSYIPVGQLDGLLYYHQRSGKNVAVYSNKPSKFQMPHQPITERYFQRLNSIRSQTSWIDLRPDKFNHLKLAIIRYEGGERVAYVGSHAFHEFSVWAGTSEMALRTTDPELMDELEAFAIDNLHPPEIDIKK